MAGIWRRGKDGLDTVLRAEAPRPSDEFVKGLARTVGDDGVPRRRSNVAFAGAASALVLAALVATGAFGYASAGAQSAATATKDLIAKKTSAQDEYGTTKPLTPPTSPKQKAAGKTASKPPTASAVSGGTLPFTGLSVAGTAAIGAALIGVGLALRRRERRE